MNPFVINLLLIVWWSTVFRPSSNNVSKARFIVCVSIQLLFLTAMSPLVSDANQYLMYARLDSYGNLELGWVLFSKLVWLLCPSGKALVLATSAIFLLSVGRFIFRHSKSTLLSYIVFICLGFWGMSFFILRQTLALSIILFAYDALEERSLAKFILLVALASMFHQTSWTFLLAWPFCTRKRDDALRIVLEVALAAILLVAPRAVLGVLMSQFRNGVMYAGNEVAGEGYGYLIVLFLVVFFISLFDRLARDGVFQKLSELSLVLQLGSLSFSLLVRIVH